VSAPASSALEDALSEHAAHDRLARIYNPSILARADVLGQDIAYFLKLQPHEDWKIHPSVQPLLENPPSALAEYVERIRSLGRDDGSLPKFEGYTYPPPPAESWLLLAHAYVRYLGDLNGGQTLKLRVAKAYDLNPSALDGLRFFEFDGRDGAMASPAELSRLSGAFKKGMDATGEELTPSERGKLSLVQNRLARNNSISNMLIFSFFSRLFARSQSCI
jgi:heme oxygenase